MVGEPGSVIVACCRSGRSPTPTPSSATCSSSSCTIVELVFLLMEKQALRRVDRGDPTEEQVDALGSALVQLEQAMDDLTARSDLTTADLAIDRDPLGHVLAEDR